MWQRHLAGSWLVFGLLLAALACNLTPSNDDSNGAVNNVSASPPTVTILSAPTAATVNQPLSVEVEARTTSGNVTLVELLVNGLSVVQQPGNGANPFRTTLQWTPLRQGTIQISVVAYQGISASTPQTLSLSVGNTPVSSNPDPIDSGSGGGSNNFTPSAPNQGPCRAQMTTDLRFRSEPSTASANTILTVFASGTEAPVLGRLGDNSWFQVTNPANGQSGWVFYNNNDGQFFTLIGVCVSIAVLQSPTTPTPIPTSTPAPTIASNPADIVALPITGSTSIQLDSAGSATGTYSLRIRNNGGSNTGAFQVLIALPDGGELLRDVSNLAPGQELSLGDGGGQQVVTFTSAGQRAISIFADFRDTVSESNEGNNFQILDITITTP